MRFNHAPHISGESRLRDRVDGDVAKQTVAERVVRPQHGVLRNRHRGQERIE